MSQPKYSTGEKEGERRKREGGRRGRVPIWSEVYGILGEGDGTERRALTHICAREKVSLLLVVRTCGDRG